MLKHGRDECCYYGGYGFGGYGAGGYGAGGYGTGGYGGNSFVKWIYALLILIVIVLQFGRKNENRNCNNNLLDTCDGTIANNTGCGGLLGTNNCNNQLIDNSILFIIIVFLLIICSGCWGGYGAGTGGYGVGGYGGGGYY